MSSNRDGLHTGAIIFAFDSRFETINPDFGPPTPELLLSHNAYRRTAFRNAVSAA